MTPIAETIVEFYEIAQFSLKTTHFNKKWTHFIENYPFFIENYPPFIKNYGAPPERKLQPLISAYIENQIFGNNRDPWALQNNILKAAKKTDAPGASKGCHT